MVIASLSGISTIDTRYRHWYHIYPLSVYIYMYIYIHGVSVWVSSWRPMGSGIGMALVSLAWNLIRVISTKRGDQVGDGASISKRVLNSVLRIMDIATCAGYLCGISYFMDISSLSGISIIDIRYRYWYHLYQLSGYMYIYICIYIGHRYGFLLGVSMHYEEDPYYVSSRSGLKESFTSILVTETRTSS